MSVHITTRSQLSGMLRIPAIGCLAVAMTLITNAETNSLRKIQACVKGSNGCPLSFGGSFFIQAKTQELKTCFTSNALGAGLLGISCLNQRAPSSADFSDLISR